MTTPRIDEELHISEEVSSGTEECVSYTPANGEVFLVTSFHADAAFTQNAAVKLVWDYGGGGEEVVWSVKGDSKMPFIYENTGDGVKKIAVCLDNGEAGDLYMSGYAIITKV